MVALLNLQPSEEIMQDHDQTKQELLGVSRSGRGPETPLGTVLEAPVPERSFDNETICNEYIYIYIYRDR